MQRTRTPLESLSAVASRLLEDIVATEGDTPPPWDDARFEEHSLALLRAQYAAVPAYRSWCDHELRARGKRLEDVRSWQQIPALPIAAFKRLQVTPTGGQTAAEWWSSGTTGAGTSRHTLHGLELYEASISAGVRRALLPDESMRERPLLAMQLAPPAGDAPHSSLSHMLDLVRTRMCDDGGAWVNGSFELDAWGLWTALATVQRPVLLLATSFALVQLLDAAPEERVSLPVGSRVMDTGGYKGRSREVSREDLLAAMEARLGVPGGMCENEYGMSELSTQAWSGSVAAHLAAPLTASGTGRWQPPWMRTLVVDPMSLTPVADGAAGLLVHHDLANVWSCAAVRTEDLGVRRGESYELLGRAPGAELRGCSLQLEDVL